MVEWPVPIDGGCPCGSLRYRMHKSPMFVHCCSCHRCQRESGSAILLNVIIEDDQVTILPSKIPERNTVVKPKSVVIPTDSGLGQLTQHCPVCYGIVWSYYAGAGPNVKFVKMGTIDKHNVEGKNIEDVLRPDIYLYNKSKQCWMVFPESAEKNGLVMDEFYEYDEKWSKEALNRSAKTAAEAAEWKKGGYKWKEAFEDIVDCR